jgi:hypothetical protein
MQTELTTPLSRIQIDAAIRLQDRLAGGAPSARALDLLSERLPGFDLESCLIKTAVLNQLFYTNVRAVTRMGRRVHDVMRQNIKEFAADELVEQLAHLPKSEEHQREWNHISFASKFAHFFINSEMFPIYDSYADKMLIFHLGYAAAILDQDHVYRAFTLNFNTLKALLQFDCTTRELDKYLWLAGVYRKWRKNPQNSKINVDAHRLFVNASGETTRDLEIMMG